MQSNPNYDNLHKIVILNPKGGSGKTTLATNLASYFAKRGPPPTLIDCDPLGYSMRWLDNRSSKQPKVYGIAAHQHCTDSGKDAELHAWPGSRQMIVDLPAAIPENKLYYETYDADSILIPITPSEIDIYSAARFIANLLLVAQFDRRKKNLAIVANRTRKNTISLRMLTRFLSSLEIPVIAQLRDSQAFVHAAAQGIDICDMPTHLARNDMGQFEAIVSWLDNWQVRRFDLAKSENLRRKPEPKLHTSLLASHD
ncbi:MAG: AAA family ATPase [Woeseiaceae bacterium]